MSSSFTIITINQRITTIIMFEFTTIYTLLYIYIYIYFVLIHHTWDKQFPHSVNKTYYWTVHSLVAWHITSKANRNMPCPPPPSISFTVINLYIHNKALT